MRSRGPVPQLVVEVDGVVSLFGFPGPPPAGVIPAAVEGIPRFLPAHAGPLLARLSDPFASASRTGRRERAETHPPRLPGPPGGWPHRTFLKVDKGPARHWKLDAVSSSPGPIGTSGARRRGRGRSEPEHRQLGQRPQAQRQAGGAEAGGDEQVPAPLDHVRAEVPVAVARR